MSGELKTAAFSASLLRTFYGLTVNHSVWQVHIGKEKWTPYLEKIAEKWESDIPIGAIISNGKMVAAGRQLILFEPEGGNFANSKFEREISRVSEDLYWGGRTSLIAAFFLDLSMALQCVKKECFDVCDARWEKYTGDVLRRIGDNHPNCSIPVSPSLRLMPPEKWQK